MTTIELESKVFRIGKCHATVALLDGDRIVDVEVVSICGGPSPTLWISRADEDIFIPVFNVASIETVA
ncbi:MAG: hypothetical protein M0019_02240 [Actinomycetota bacterium]|nr:hypothetical protein [Actinomycetota bacterium]